MRTIYLDGQYLKVNIQIINTFTPGIFNAKGVFETLLGLDGFVMDTTLHLNRLRAGLKILEIDPPSINPLILKEVLQRNQLSSARVRIMVWRAPPVAGQAGQQVHVMAAALPYRISNKRMYRVCLIETDRRASDRFANVKSLDYEGFAQAYAQARAQGFDEALLLNKRGHIFEASRANIFWIKDRILYTPPLSSGCLNGITRQQVIKQAVALKIAVEEKNLDPAILEGADAAFLTNSLLGIKPIEVPSISNIKIA
jgi:branched-subunit amino acid aminotransferase/4-amino-4-deoxychorismate lyase